MRSNSMKADNGASACGSMTATHEQWLAMIGMGWSPSMVGQNGRLYSGVEAAAGVMAEQAGASAHERTITERSRAET